jgi:hypothetical protein
MIMTTQVPVNEWGVRMRTPDIRIHVDRTAIRHEDTVDYEDVMPRSIKVEVDGRMVDLDKLVEAYEEAQR